MTFRIASALIFSTLSLAACAGGGGAEAPADAMGPGSGGSATPVTATQIALFDQTATEATALSAHQIDSTAGTVTSRTGTLDHGIDQFSLGGWTGALDKTTGDVVIAGGGTATVTEGATDHVAIYSAQRAGANPVFGVVGQATDVADMPSGLATFTGVSEVTIIDSVANFDLAGTTQIDVDFGTGRMSVTMDNLSGTRTTGIGASASLTDVARIDVTNMTVTGNGFSGGTATLSSPYVLGTLTGNEVTETAGGFYGPKGVEAGGVLRVDDTATGDLLIQGAFVGSQ